jgi:hypothetical protein
MARDGRTRDAYEEIDAFLHGSARAPPRTLPPTVESGASRQPVGMSRQSEAYLLQLIAMLNAHVDTAMAEQRPVEASPVTVMDVDERRQLPDNGAYIRTCERLTIAHCSADVHDLPVGDDLQRLIFAMCARPPFRLSAAAGVKNTRVSLSIVRDILIKFLALSPVGIVRLREPYFLLTAEWLVEYSGQSGIAVVLKSALGANEASTIPAGLVVNLGSLTPVELKRDQFLYAGFMVVDLALVTATAGVPDFVK